MSLIFEKFNAKQDLQKQRDLFVECFPENKGTSVESLDHYFWKFHSGPFNPHSFEYIARNDEGEFMGYYAALPYPYSINHDSASAGMVCDVMTGVKARGKGIFTKLGAYSTDELSKKCIPFTTGYPIRKEVIPGHLKVGWKIVMDLPLYIKVLKVNNFSIFKRFKFLSPIINWILDLVYSVRFFSKEQYSTRIISPEEIDSLPGYDDFFTTWKKSITNYLIKSKEFLKWRLGAPEKRYNLIAVYKNNTLCGFVITTKTIKEGISSLAILDIMVTNPKKHILSYMHWQIEQLARKENLEAILVMASSKWASLYKFMRNGYLKSPFKFVLIIKKLTNHFTDNQLFTPENWHLMWIDSDDL